MDAPRDVSFARMASSYDKGAAGRASRRFYALVAAAITLPPGARVLDVGCGTGALLGKLAQNHVIECHGVDVESQMIAVAASRHPGMDFQVASATELPFEDATFDAVIACMAYHHFADKTGFAREAGRVLRPQGVLYICDPNFPAPVRFVVDGLLRRMHITGEFLTPQETYLRCAPAGLIPYGHATDAYAQVVLLQKPGITNSST